MQKTDTRIANLAKIIREGNICPEEVVEPSLRDTIQNVVDLPDMRNINLVFVKDGGYYYHAISTATWTMRICQEFFPNVGTDELKQLSALAVLTPFVSNGTDWLKDKLKINNENFVAVVYAQEERNRADLLINSPDITERNARKFSILRCARLFADFVEGAEFVLEQESCYDRYKNMVKDQMLSPAEEYSRQFKQFIQRDGADKLLSYLTGKYCNFLDSPFDGDTSLPKVSLVAASVQMPAMIAKIIDLMQAPIPAMESLAVVGLLANIGRTNVWKKSEETFGETLYIYDEEIPYGIFSAKSVFLVQPFMRLKREESLAIRWSMGTLVEEESKALRRVFMKNKLTFATACANLLVLMNPSLVTEKERSK